MKLRSRLRNIPDCACIVLIGLIAAAGTESPAAMPIAPNETSVFRFQGRPVHPGCLLLLTSDLADVLPTCAAVDVEGCARSNRFCSPDAIISRQNGWYRMANIAIKKEGYFEYRCLGHSKEGIFVVETAMNGGGSGVFEDLLFVRFANDRVWQDGKWRDRTMLLFCGSYGLEDRDNRQIELRNDQVEIDKSAKNLTPIIIPIPSDQTDRQ